MESGLTRVVKMLDGKRLEYRELVDDPPKEAKSGLARITSIVTPTEHSFSFKKPRLVLTVYPPRPANLSFHLSSLFILTNEMMTAVRFPI